MLKWGFMSAEGSTRQRASVSRGRRGGSMRRACRAERREEFWALEGGGEGSERKMSSVAEGELTRGKSASSGVSASSSPYS